MVSIQINPYSIHVSGYWNNNDATMDEVNVDIVRSAGVRRHISNKRVKHTPPGIRVSLGSAAANTVATGCESRTLQLFTQVK